MSSLLALCDISNGVKVILALYQFNSWFPSEPHFNFEYELIRILWKDFAAACLHCIKLRKYDWGIQVWKTARFDFHCQSNVMLESYMSFVTKEHIISIAKCSVFPHVLQIWDLNILKKQFLSCMWNSHFIGWFSESSSSSYKLLRPFSLNILYIGRLIKRFCNNYNNRRTSFSHSVSTIKLGTLYILLAYRWMWLLGILLST